MDLSILILFSDIQKFLIINKYLDFNQWLFIQHVFLAILYMYHVERNGESGSDSKCANNKTSAFQLIALW